MLRAAASAAARGARSAGAGRLVDSAATARWMATGKDLRFATEARDLMARGVNSLADAVSVTLGPRGRNVVIEKSYGGPQITKDGVTVARNIDFADKHMNVGAQLVRSVAKDTNDIAGDGTTTATVLTRAIYTEGIKAVAAGMNPMDLKRGIDLAVEKVLAALKEMTRSIHSKEEISSVRWRALLPLRACRRGWRRARVHSLLSGGGAPPACAARMPTRCWPWVRTGGGRGFLRKDDTYLSFSEVFTHVDHSINVIVTLTPCHTRRRRLFAGRELPGRVRGTLCSPAHRAAARTAICLTDPKTQLSDVPVWCYM